MKKISAPPAPVPRLNSLLHRLQKTPGPEDEPYLDQLMIFLEDPPDGVTDRWKAGAEMCHAWGIATTGTSVYRLYQSYLIEWRVRIALKIDDAEAGSAEVLGEKVARQILLRTGEMLGNPSTPPAVLVGLLRANLREKYLEFARQKHRDRERDENERALTNLEARVQRNRYARFAYAELKAALAGKPPPPAVETLFPGLIPRSPFAPSA
jgi:hypothetical protein